MKPLSHSKTLWFNATVAGLATLEASAGLIQPYVQGNIYGYAVLVITVGNAILRVVTTQGVTLK